MMPDQGAVVHPAVTFSTTTTTVTSQVSPPVFAQSFTMHTVATADEQVGPATLPCADSLMAIDEESKSDKHLQLCLYASPSTTSSTSTTTISSGGFGTSNANSSHAFQLPLSPTDPPAPPTIKSHLGDGHAYTYLGLKTSTRSTYCCIYRAQPMFAPQAGRLSMYSNWQTTSVKDEDRLFDLLSKPTQVLTLFCLRRGQASSGRSPIYSSSTLHTSRSPSTSNIYPSISSTDNSIAIVSNGGDNKNDGNNPSSSLLGSCVWYRKEELILSTSDSWSKRQELKRREELERDLDDYRDKLRAKGVVLEPINDDNANSASEVILQMPSPPIPIPTPQRTRKMSVFSGPMRSNFSAILESNHNTVSQELSILPPPPPVLSLEVPLSATLSSRFSPGPMYAPANGRHHSTVTEPLKLKIFEGGFKSNENYTYIRGRGRGKYVCEECGIRCKKPSMLKKHIRTHTDLRPYTCRYCAFAFKTKGNLTKHMKSKAHHKKCIELGITPVPTNIDESQIDFDALHRQEALEKSYQRFVDGVGGDEAEGEEDLEDDEPDLEEEEEEEEDDEGVPIPVEHYAKYHIHGHRVSVIKEPVGLRSGEAKSGEDSFTAARRMSMPVRIPHAKQNGHSANGGELSAEQEAIQSLLALSRNRPSQPCHGSASVTFDAKERNCQASSLIFGKTLDPAPKEQFDKREQTSPIQSSASCELGTGAGAGGLLSAALTGKPINSSALQRLSRQRSVSYAGMNMMGSTLRNTLLGKIPEHASISATTAPSLLYKALKRGNHQETDESDGFQPKLKKLSKVENSFSSRKFSSSRQSSETDVVEVLDDDEDDRASDNDSNTSLIVDQVVLVNHFRAQYNNPSRPSPTSYDRQRRFSTPVMAAVSGSPLSVTVSADQPIDLSVGSAATRRSSTRVSPTQSSSAASSLRNALIFGSSSTGSLSATVSAGATHHDDSFREGGHAAKSPNRFQSINELLSAENTFCSPLKSMSEESASSVVVDLGSDQDSSSALDNGFLIPTGSASENIDKIGTRNSSGQYVCNSCQHVAASPALLIHHAHVHMIERPYRCEPCGLGFRTNGQLQKHKRSGEHTKRIHVAAEFGTVSEANPRPFRCHECTDQEKKIVYAFRIHGHLAKHLRSKCHIQQLEINGKLPFGMFAELERSGHNMNDIDTTNCESALNSLRQLAERIFSESLVAEEPNKSPASQPAMHSIEWRLSSGLGHSNDASSSVENSRASIAANDLASLHGIEVRRRLDQSSSLRPCRESPDAKRRISMFELSPSASRTGQSRDAMLECNQTDSTTSQESHRRMSCVEQTAASSAASDPHRINTCPTCRQVFKNLKALRVHTYTEHPDDDSPNVGTSN